MRRKRYEVIGIDSVTGLPKRYTSLGYSETSMREWAERHHDVIVLDVVPVARQVRPKQPWRIDHVALNAACEWLDVRWPVNVKRTANGKSLHGRHRLRGRNEWPTPRHVITLAAGLPQALASEVLWHELAHAMQAERGVRTCPVWSGLNAIEMMKLWTVADIRDRRYAYDDRPCEIEARRYEKRGRDFPLVKATRS